MKSGLKQIEKHIAPKWDDKLNRFIMYNYRLGLEIRGESEYAPLFHTKEEALIWYRDQI